MRYTLNLPLCIYSISLFYSLLWRRLGLVDGYLNDVDPDNNEKDSVDKMSFGALGTLSSLIQWAAREEAIVHFLSRRRAWLQEERQRILERQQNTLRRPRGKRQGWPSLHRRRGLQQNRVAYMTESENYILNSKLGRVEMYMSMGSFLHTQQVYGFRAKNIKIGTTLDSWFGADIKPCQSGEMGSFALFRKCYYMAVDWLEEAVASLHVKCHAVKSLLMVAIQEHNRIWNRPQAEVDYHTYMNTFTAPVTMETTPAERKTERQRLHYRYNQEKSLKQNFALEAQFMTLCNSDSNPGIPKQQDNFRCFYNNKGNPYLYVAPVKVEQLATSPPIFQYYDLIGNKTADYIKQLYDPLVKPSKFSGHADLEKLTHVRTSMSAFIKTGDIPDRVFLLAGMVTGLNFVSALESSQYTVYTYGRFINYHADNLEDPIHGDRVATLLYYLEIPNSGGDTAFCQAGIYARPIRNSAIFWPNVYRNGSKRLDVEHGSCPVIHGHKIIINQWIRYNDNWKDYKCSLNRYE